MYRRQLAENPQSVLALNNLAWLQRKTNPEQGIEYIERASALAPEDPVVMSTHATLLAANGQAAEGEQMLRKAVAQNPDNMQTKLDLGRLLIELGKADAARPYLDAVIANSSSEGLVAQARDLLEGTSKEEG